MDSFRASRGPSEGPQTEETIRYDLEECDYGKLKETVLRDVLNFMDSHPNFKTSITYEGKQSDRVLVLYGKERLNLDEYLQLYAPDPEYSMSIVLPLGYPYKAPKVYILDELKEYDNEVITKNNKVRTEELKDWKSFNSIDL